MKSAKDLLASALRQYQHNDCSGFVFAYDKKETVKVVNKLRTQLVEADLRVKELEKELEIAVELVEQSGVDYDEATEHLREEG